MPSHAGPNTAGESNIIFSYDTSDTTNSYRGEPTTNMWGIESGTNVNNRSTWSMPYAYNGAITDSVYSAGTWNGNRIWEVLHTTGTSGYAGFESWRLCVNQPTAGNTIYNTTRRVAIKICILEGSITDLALHSGGGNSSHDASNWTPIPESQVPRDCPQKTGWYQFLADGSWASNSVGHCVGLAFISYNRVRILTTEPMYYPSNKLIPFTGYQRSATQGLLPLISNTSINLSSVSFNSAAQITYDGTDDRIDLGNLGTIGTTYTIECIFNSSNVVNYKNVFDMNYETYPGVTGNVGPRLEQYSDGTITVIWSGNTVNNSIGVNTPVTPISANTNYHMVFTQDGNNGSIYLNGAYKSQNSNTYGYIQTFADANLGRGFSLAGDRYFAGTLPVFKIYNIALSAEQIKQNYQQYKTRFNLS